MLGISLRKLGLLAVATMSLGACSDDAANGTTASAAKKPPPASTAARSPGKPSAPISIDYEVMGKAFVGLPVAINVRVRGTRDDVGPVAVSYTINDTSALLFQEGQVERLELDELSETSVQQLAVIPQREGRLYINVSAEVTTPGGSMIRSMAIPIQVGTSAVPQQTRGELKEDADGDTVLSMPAREN